MSHDDAALGVGRDVMDYNEYETMSHDDMALEMEHIGLW